ncbi:MAG TPA: PilZ domain-containing protein [Polyangiaceae bacterium]|nr:PilZ domain-containing protein [Polyangiaceae bacterium]
MNEKRRDRRFPVELPMTLKVGKKSISGFTVNASFKGLLVRADDPPGVRQLVQLDLQLPSGEAFNAHMQVIHSGNGVAGLEFFGRSNNPKWDEFVQALTRQAGGTPAGGVSIAPQAGPSVQPGQSLPPPGQSMPAPQRSSMAPPVAGASASPPPGQPPQGQTRRSGPTGAYAGPERRRAPRISMQLELRLRTPRSIHTAFTTDVSMLSAGLMVPEWTSGIGEQVIVNLIQPGTSFSFRRDGIVKRITPVDGTWTHVGVEFAALEQMREVLFADFMNSAYATIQAKPR